jgi:hypothetical protein
VLGDGFKSFLGRGPSSLTISEPIHTYDGLRLAEVSRHFDENTVASITGWLSHDLGFHGWGVGGRVGGVGLGVGRLGLSGTSQVSLTSSGTTRQNLLGDGFVAVFEVETADGLDTLRMVVPSEQTARELVTAMLDDIGASFTRVKNRRRTIVYGKASTALKNLAPQLLSFPYEASYISDRLTAILRSQPEARPRITVYGSPLSQHAVLASGIRIGASETVQPLFPVTLVTMLQEVGRQAIDASRHGVPIVLSNGEGRGTA